MRTHEAAYKILEELGSNQLKNCSEATKQCIKTLITSALYNDNIDIEKWYCDSRCKYINTHLCDGVSNTDKEADKRCTYFKI